LRKFSKNEDYMILYYCPDLEVKSAGIRRLYDHVWILNEAGIPAAILHNSKDFKRKDLHDVPIKGLDEAGAIQVDDIIVIPEGFPGLMRDLKDAPVRRFAICLSWDYTFRSLESRENWRNFGIERIIGASPFTVDMTAWAMKLPGHVIPPKLNRKLYFPSDFPTKKKKIVYIKRKGGLVPLLMNVLYSQNPEFINAFEWLPLDALSEEDFAKHVRQAAIFLNMSTSEGLAHACFEAMASRTLVCGFSSIGGQRVFKSGQNGLFAETGDYLTLAWLMTPLLDDILSSNHQPWDKIIQTAYESTLEMNAENEKNALISFWRRMTR
jgi:hypothetical protein